VFLFSGKDIGDPTGSHTSSASGGLQNKPYPQAVGELDGRGIREAHEGLKEVVIAIDQLKLVQEGSLEVARGAGGKQIMHSAWGSGRPREMGTPRVRGHLNHMKLFFYTRI